MKHWSKNIYKLTGISSLLKRLIKSICNPNSDNESIYFREPKLLIIEVYSLFDSYPLGLVFSSRSNLDLGYLFRICFNNLVQELGSIWRLRLSTPNRRNEFILLFNHNVEIVTVVLVLLLESSIELIGTLAVVVTDMFHGGGCDLAENGKFTKI